MNKENRDLLVNSIIILLIATLFVFVFSLFMPKTTEDNIFGRVVKLEETTLTQNPSEVKAKYIAKDGKKEVGTVYLVEVEGTFGLLVFYVGIDKNELVSVEMIEITQSSFAIKGLNKYVKDEFKNVPKDEVKDVRIYSVADLDTSAGMTASTSPSELVNSVLKVLEFHYDEKDELTELEVLFGKDVTLELDNTFTATPEVLSRSKALINSNVVGFMYRVKGTGVYNGDASGSIEIDFALNPEGIYLGQIIDLDNYSHTPGFRKNALKALEPVINTNINDIIIEDLDATAGATNTSNLMIKMLGDLKLVFTPMEELTEVEELFGKGAVLEVDNTFTATPEVLSRSKALINSNVVGFMYEVKGTGVYFGTNSNSIIINFALDNDGIYLGEIVDLDNYNHTPGFRDRALTILNDLKGTNINDLVVEELDTTTGATNTSTIITEMLDNLKGVFQ